MKKLWLVALALHCLILTNAFALEKTITLKQLTTQDSISFVGPGAEKALYFPAPTHWQINHISLHLLVKNSNMPNHPTSLTAFVNNQPINSFNLQSMASQPASWDMTLPSSVIQGETVTMIIKSGWEIKDGTVCRNFSDPSFWTTLDGQSTITYDYSEKPFLASLATFPQPFINSSAIEKDHVTFVLPNEFDHNDLETLFFATQTLTRLQTWRGILLDGIKDIELNDSKRNTTHLIVIGNGKNNSLLSSTTISWPLAQNNQHEWIDQHQQKIPDDTGIIMIASSPWNPHYAILAITGNSDVAIKKAVSWLRYPKLNRSLLATNYALIKQTPATSPLLPINWSQVSFKELGFKTQTIYGNGENTLNYVIKLPPDKIAKNMTITVNYKTSPLLSKTANSFLALSVNQQPISGIRLNPDTGDEETWQINIKGDDLLRGDNLLSFTFHLKFHNNACENDDETLAYASINATSSLDVHFKNKSGWLNFHSFNGTYNPVTLFLPTQDQLFSSSDLLSTIIAFGKALIHVPAFNIADDANILNKTYQTNDLIFIGKFAQNKVLAGIQAHFPISFKNGLLDIKPSLLPLIAMSGETPNALLEIIPSPFFVDRTLLLISANTLNDYDLALDVLSNESKNRFLKGDTALIYANGTYTSINTQELLARAENKHRILEANLLGSTGLITFLIVFFGGIGLLIIYRRLRRYFSKNGK